MIPFDNSLKHKSLDIFCCWAQACVNEICWKDSSSWEVRLTSSYQSKITFCLQLNKFRH
jgi:hypothetical protein